MQLPIYEHGVVSLQTLKIPDKCINYEFSVHILVSVLGFFDACLCLYLCMCMHHSGMHLFTHMPAVIFTAGNADIF